MERFIDPVEAKELIDFALVGFALVWISAGIYTLLVLKYIRGRVITFWLVLWTLFLSFILPFFGLDFLMREFWNAEETLGDATIRVLSIAAASFCLALLALNYKWRIHDGPSLLQKELEELDEDKLSPFDVRRREHMQKFRRK